MLKVGLTGGIGSGKSEAARLLTARGAVIIDADLLAREVVEPGTPGLEAVVAAFGADLIGPDGGLDRGALAARVFTDEGARRRLEAIVHPLVAARAADLMATAAQDAVVVYDVPLLVESGGTTGFDVVVVVDADDPVRLARLAARGLEPADARARMAAQASRAARLAAADLVVPNNGTLDELAAAVAALWTELVRRLSG